MPRSFGITIQSSNLFSQIKQDVYAITVRLLVGLGHDVVTAFQLGLAQAEDAELLRVTQQQSRILITCDRDFGGLVFVHGGGAGVIYLRMLPSTLNAVHSELERVLTLYSDHEPADWPGGSLDRNALSAACQARFQSCFFGVHGSQSGSSMRARKARLHMYSR